MITISGISAVLKKVIVPELQNELPKMSVLFDKIQKNVGVSIANNNIYVASRTGKHSGIYYVAEGSNPLTGNAKYSQPYTSLKFGFGTLELTDQAIEAAKKGDVKAIASILSTEIQALKDDMRIDANRIMHGSGTGKLCLSNGTGASGTQLTVDGNPNGGEGTEYLAEGMYIVVGTSLSSAISSVDSATVVTLATAITWGNDAVVTKYGAAEPMGLAGIIDDGDNAATIQNITRASNPWANAHVYDTATTLTEANMIDVYLRCRRYGGTDVILMGKDLYQKYGTLLTSMKRSYDSKEVLKGGWKGLEFMDGCGVMLDFDTWEKYVQFVNFSSLTLAEMSNAFDWLEADAYGGILRRSPSVRTNWEGTLKYYFNLVGLKFKANGRMSGQTNV